MRTSKPVVRVAGAALVGKSRTVKMHKSGKPKDFRHDTRGLRAIPGPQTGEIPGSWRSFTSRFPAAARSAALVGSRISVGADLRGKHASAAALVGRKAGPAKTPEPPGRRYFLSVNGLPQDSRTPHFRHPACNLLPDSSSPNPR